jgi:hypothetical protein
MAEDDTYDSPPWAVPPLSVLELDQDDIVQRLVTDPFFQQAVPVLEQRKGITESDVQIALSTANQQNGSIGTCAIVLMPRLAGQDPNAPGPRYTTRYPVQVIDWPLVRRQSTGGSQVSAEQICDRVRQIIHGFNMGRGQMVYFDKLEPVAIDDGKISYIVTFKKLGSDFPPISCAAVGISPLSGGVSPSLPGPVLVTLTCATSGASIYYTIDGTYPSSEGDTAVLYSGPFTAPAGSTVRAAAELPSGFGFQQSNVISQAVYSNVLTNVTVTASSTLVANSLTTVNATVATNQALPTVPVDGMTEVVKNVGSNTTFVTSTTANIFTGTPVSSFSLGIGAAATFTWVTALSQWVVT